ncbi:hypothetical protein HSX37_16485|uniref:Cardiolipin synthase n=1 Tax=Dendrosporobacter quercicolus TaxID=146817 RepID=A0A1H0AM14_9FIRM|nr:phospholipase D family protein [Dendrosporobacter quercicolus]NSL49634.1 hypothetical protein [Dendrosporobacter quercicolus DSM 1736]SDN33866.1 cardiolipin synthase [Dendrosporobacter quercicolus]
MKEVRYLATGSQWLGRGIESVHSNVCQMIEETSQELIIVAYSIGTGAIETIDSLEALLHRGVNVKILVNRFDGQPQGIREAIFRLSQSYLNFRVFDFSPSDGSDLHAKVIISDRKRAIIGSANLSWRGMVTNHEIAVMIGDDSIELVAKVVDEIFYSDYVREI